MSGTDVSGGMGSERTVWQFVVAIALLLGFAVIIVVMFVAVDNATETEWNRMVYLLGGVEAIVFASVGWLFGREVHRSEAQTAKADAEQAKQDANAAKEEAKTMAEAAAAERAKGAATRSFVRNATAPPAATRTRAVPGDASAAPDTDPMTGLRGFVDDLWPE